MDPKAGELRKSGVRLKLQGQPFQLLEVFTARSGEVVTREELHAALWPGATFVDFDHGLNNAVQKLREVLGDSANNPRFIETIPRRGYRFLAQVEALSHGTADGRSLPTQIGPREDLWTESLVSIRQELLVTSSPSELKKLRHRIESLVDQNPGHSDLHEARSLLDEVQQALEHSLVEASANAGTQKKPTQIDIATAACVFDDHNALSRYDGFGRWLTLGTVKNQTILVDHTMQEINGREIIRIISARKATLAERRAYEKKK
jgi:DNA-binding winged helix-turn-helix (wHTH) protein/uncharacterized DUF497 family protein